MQLAVPAGATFSTGKLGEPSHFSKLPRQSSPCLPTLQGTCTAPRPIRHSSLHARELTRRWLVRPEILRFRLSPETDPVRDPNQTRARAASFRNT
jgi:hypothetical protein